MKYLIMIGFVVMAAAQWYVPGSMIFESEKTANEGIEYKFKTAPVDPSDPFRGKYVTLSFLAEEYNPIDTNEIHFSSYQSVYVSVVPDNEGFAKIVKLTADPPEDDVDYFAATFQYGQNARLTTFPDTSFMAKPYIQLEFPFQTFYVEETKASEIEKQYWEQRMDSTVNCYAVVRIREGHSTLVDVRMNDRSFTDIIREINESKK